MTLDQIIDTLLRTPEVKGTRLELAALCARDKHPPAMQEVTEFWTNNGGTVQESA